MDVFYKKNINLYFESWTFKSEMKFSTCSSNVLSKIIKKKTDPLSDNSINKRPYRVWQNLTGDGACREHEITLILENVTVFCFSFITVIALQGGNDCKAPQSLHEYTEFISESIWAKWSSASLLTGTLEGQKLFICSDASKELETDCIYPVVVLKKDFIRWIHPVIRKRLWEQWDADTKQSC